MLIRGVMISARVIDVIYHYARNLPPPIPLPPTATIPKLANESKGSLLDFCEYNWAICSVESRNLDLKTGRPNQPEFCNQLENI